jgi:hypothetical protein
MLTIPAKPATRAGHRACARLLSVVFFFDLLELFKRFQICSQCGNVIGRNQPDTLSENLAVVVCEFVPKSYDPIPFDRR